MSGKASMTGPGGDMAQEEILKKLEDNSAQRQIDVGGGIMVNMGQEDYGTELLHSKCVTLLCFGNRWQNKCCV